MLDRKMLGQRLRVHMFPKLCSQDHKLPEINFRNKRTDMVYQTVNSVFFGFPRHSQE